MATHLVRVSRTSRPPGVQVLCPACRSIRKARPVGVATIDGKRREILQCSEKTCELTWVPSKAHVPASAPRAA
ncbi:hypothetical protein [Streptacidiphilus sp. EB103A]|uniref:hypothetical protein n=1 Tax=Streptacidiphilus sp. EB103A TaxID=3156275 RepID=UPI00351925D3